MLRRLVASTLVMGSAVALSTPSANAQSVNVPFSGTMPSNCTFGTPTPGVLVPDGSAALVANLTKGTLGSVSLQCTSPANITVSAPIQTSGPGISLPPGGCVAAILRPGGAILASNTSCGGTGIPVQVSGTNNLTVVMSVASDRPIPPGDYAYNVTLTIAP
jgi:hypothetical protein